MKFFKGLLVSWLCAPTITEARHYPFEVLSSRSQASNAAEVAPLGPAPTVSGTQGSCVNGPNSRTCWKDGYSINTDFEYVAPGGIYYLVVSNQKIAPDGYMVDRMLVNGTYPGPLIEANWGDLLNITVFNNLTNYNGTSIHWHGIRQFNSTYADGVPGVTQCPIPPGEQMTYTWRATQYGVSWYHSHFSLQYPDGIVGPLKINGPTSMNYDEDLGPVLITDWLHKDAFSLLYLDLLGRPPSADSNLLNGKGPYYCCPSLDPACTGGTPYTSFNFTTEKTYRMSVVNTAVNTHFTFWIDDHDFYVIATDFVPIQPYFTDTLNVAIGQRYDIIVIAKNETTKRTDFWIHARDCSLVGQPSGLGIIRYDPSSTDLPITPRPSRLCFGCLDESSKNMVPIVERTVDQNINPFGQDHAFEAGLVGDPDPYNENSTFHKWVLANSSFYLNWDQPSLDLLATSNGSSGNNPFPAAYAPVFLDYLTGTWAYFLIEGKFSTQDSKLYRENIPLAHPIHVHGHNFCILASGNETYDPSKVQLNLNNPTRRDVAMLPVNGYLIIAFQVNNPGTWLMHCHIAWHASNGLALQFVEQQEKIVPLLEAAGVEPALFEQCDKWGAYYADFNEKYNATQEDSGV